MKNLVVLSGAGISKESGIPTFRDNDGLWKKFSFQELATLDAWIHNQDIMLEFYNIRRKEVMESEPNKAHLTLKELEKDFNVQIITQNVDDLHERAGSTNVLHLHGEIRKARSSVDDSIIVDIEGSELNPGDLCPLGSQLRPHIVWFGEAVPMMTEAIKIVETADIFLVIGTGLQVYPAASLVHYLPSKAARYIIDPGSHFQDIRGFKHIQKTAVQGITDFVNEIL